MALMFVAVVQSHATPIRPDLKKLLSEPQPKADLPLARAGWNGPETPPPSDGYADSSVERSMLAARASRASVAAATVPDYRAVAGILLVILLLRRIRKQPRLEVVSSHVPSTGRSGGMSRAA
jgi:hypothetical protein